jgi:hypothetical protein
MPKKSETSTKKSETKTKYTNAKSTTAKSSTKPLGIKPEEFNLSRLFLKPIDEKYSSGGSQLNAFPKYDNSGKEDNLRTERSGDNFIVFTDPIKLTRGGVPKIDGQYKKSDADREYFWLPWDPEQKSSDNFFKMCTQIDEEYNRLINEKDNIDTVMLKGEGGKTKRVKGIFYERIVKEASGPDDVSDSDSDDGSESDDSNSKKKKSKKGAKDSNKKSEKNKFQPYKRLKVRFSTKYDDKRSQTDPKEIDTLLFRGSNEDPEDLKTVSDFEREMPWNSTVVLVLMFNKFWVQKSAPKGKKLCSFSVKVIQIVVTEKAESQGKQAVTEIFRHNIYASHGAKPEPNEKLESLPDKDSDDKDSDGGSDKDSDAEHSKASEHDDESGESDEDRSKETKKGSGKKTNETVKDDEGSDSESDKESNKDSDNESDKDDADSKKEPVKETKTDKKKPVEKKDTKKGKKEESDHEDTASDKSDSDTDKADSDTDTEPVKETKTDKKKPVEKKDTKKGKKEESDHEDTDSDTDKGTDDSDDEPQEKKRVSAKSTKKGKKEEPKPKSKKSGK